MTAWLAAVRAQLRLRLRAGSTWAFAGLGLLLTVWGTLLDILAVGVEEGRAQGVAAASGGLVGILLGAWIGSNTPARHSLDERESPGIGLPDAPWALPAARCSVAGLLGAGVGLLCMLYTVVLSQYVSPLDLGSGLLAGAIPALLAAAWASFLTPRVGGLVAAGTALGLGVLGHVGLSPAVRALLPHAPPAGSGAWAASAAALLATVGLVALTPGRGLTLGQGRVDPGSRSAP